MEDIYFLKDGHPHEVGIIVILKLVQLIICIFTTDNKGCGMCYPVCGMRHIKEPLLLIGKSSPCGSSGFPLLLSEWSFTICMTPYNRK